MRSDTVKRGFERAPHPGLLKATGAVRGASDVDRPFTALCNSYVDAVGVAAGCISLNVSDTELSRRLPGFPSFVPPIKGSYLERYSYLVARVSQGAVPPRPALASGFHHGHGSSANTHLAYGNRYPVV